MKSQNTLAPLDIAQQGYFFVGGRYVDLSIGPVRAGQMYVEYQIPRDLRQEWPIVLLSGGLQSGLNYTGTPDGREGWAQYFLRCGYAVYVVDQPARARSPHNTREEDVRTFSSKTIERYFTAPKLTALWPEAALHTQWPGTGVAGDPVFDQYMDQIYPSLADTSLQQQLNRDAGAALLDRIGPAILLTHSQAGAYGWLIADARPGQVKAIVAIEPSGPPVHERAFGVAAVKGESVVEQSAFIPGTPPSEGWREDGALTKPFGLTKMPLTYDPPLDPGKTLQFVKDDAAQGAPAGAGWLQANPARELVHLQDVPVLVVTGEASYHAVYDHCTVNYLRQAGVKTAHIKLAEQGIRGNGHMMMLELNSNEIASVAEKWLELTLRS